MFFISFCGLCLYAEAQPNIVRIEYYIDTDPGFGMATPLNITPGTDIQNANIAIDPSTVGEGVHRLNVRALNAGGNWSMTNTLLFYKPYGTTSVPALTPPANITRVEYYIDTDPGFGIATPVNITPGTDIQDAIIPIDPATLTEGVHRLNLRSQNANGNWSMTNTLLFYKPYGTTGVPALPPPANITRVEYYIDADPGFGIATPVNITPGTDIQDAIIAINPGTLSQGVHRLNVRSQNANGHWSQTNTLLFYKPYSVDSIPPQAAIANTTAIEYYIGTDPGFGKGRPVSFTPGTDLADLVIPVDITGLAIGNYTLYVRAKDEKGLWSMTNKWAFKVDSVLQRAFTVGKITASLCAGSPVSVPVKVNAAFGAGNVFTAQLSNNVGNFANPVSIGTLTGTASDTIKAVIPANLPAGSNYRIRVIASTPRDTTDYNDTAIVISRVPEASFSVTGKSFTCLGTESYGPNQYRSRA